MELVIRSIGTWDVRDTIAMKAAQAPFVGDLDLLNPVRQQPVLFGGATLHVSHFIDSAAPLTEHQSRAADELIEAGWGFGHEGRGRRETAMFHRLMPDGEQRHVGRSA